MAFYRFLLLVFHHFGSFSDSKHQKVRAGKHKKDEMWKEGGWVCEGRGGGMEGEVEGVECKSGTNSEVRSMVSHRC